MENIEGHYQVSFNAGRDPIFMVLVTIEESLEMAAILYFQYAILEFVEDTFPAGPPAPEVPDPHPV